MVFPILISEVPERPLVPLAAQEAPLYINRDRKKKGMFGVFLLGGGSQSVQPKDSLLLELAVAKAGLASPCF